jgi:hypothetical protein
MALGNAVELPVRRLFAFGALFGLIGGFLAAFIFVLPFLLIKRPQTVADFERAMIRESAYREGYVDGARAQRDGESLKYPLNAQFPGGNP